jgi:hypothetical protein
LHPNTKEITSFTPDKATIFLLVKCLFDQRIPLYPNVVAHRSRKRIKPIATFIILFTWGVFGESDSSTPVRQVAPIFEKALASRKDKDYTIKIFPKAHHIILEAETGSDEEILRLKRYTPGYHDMMSKWILKLVKTK